MVATDDDFDLLRTPSSRAAMREQLRQQVEDFLKRGKTIYQAGPEETGQKSINASARQKKVASKLRV